MPQRPSSRLASQLRANSRLRWGLWAIAGILWLYGVLLLDDFARSERNALVAAQRRLARAEAAGTQPEWPARARAAKDALSQAEARLWREATIGLAQAALQDWVNQALQQAGIPKSSVTISALEEAGSEGKLPAYWKVTSRLTFDFNPKSLQAFLARISANEQAIDVEALTVRAGTPARVEMMLNAYFVRPAPGTPLPATITPLPPKTEAPRASTAPPPARADDPRATGVPR